LPTYGGEVRGESAIKYLDEIGTRIDHVYQVGNDGPSTASRLSILIDWPIQVENGKDQGKWLLYLIDQPVVEGDGECVLQSDFINPLKLKNIDGKVDQPLLYGYSGMSLKYEASTTFMEESSSEASGILFDNDDFKLTSETDEIPAGAGEGSLSSNDINAVEETEKGGVSVSGSKTSYSREEKIFRSKETRVESSRAESSSSKSASSGSKTGYSDFYDDEHDNEHVRRKRELERKIEPKTIKDKNGNSELVVVFVSL
jgi:hypothetical protein